MKPWAVIDFETASACDLKKCGAAVYWEDPTTEILCLGAQFNGNLADQEIWTPGQDMPRLKAHIRAGGRVVVHNAGFEKAGWRNQMVPVYGFPDIPLDQWHDTMAVAAMKAVPLQLDKLAKALRLQNHKDDAGSRLTIGLSKPDKHGMSKITPDALASVIAYNRQDLRAESEACIALGDLQECERPVWLFDQVVNARGVRVDLSYVRACQAVVDGARKPLDDEFRALTGLSPTQDVKVRAWLQSEGVDMPNMQKETLARVLGVVEEPDDGSHADEDLVDELPSRIILPPHCRRALEIRRVVGSASIKKLAAIERTACADSRVRNTLQYHGAGPGRFTARLIQPQNFPRGTLKMEHVGKDGLGFQGGIPVDLLVDTLLTADPEYVRMILGEPIEAVISGLRHAIVAAPGRRLVVGDFAAIEARVVLALAGQWDKVALIAQGVDIYIDMAMQIYGRPIDKKKDPEERQTGKNSVLGLGFQMGKDKFFDRYCSGQSIEFAKRVVDIYRQEWAPEVPAVWRALEHAALKTVVDGTPHEAYGVRYAHEGQWLTARLPSGRKLYYFNPRRINKAMPWDPDIVKPAWSCQAMKTGRWITRDMYGGLLTENVVQALARDLLIHSALICERENLPVVLTVHDELVTEPLIGHGGAKMLEQIMCDRPAWAIEMQIPVAAECWEGERYKK